MTGPVADSDKRDWSDDMESYWSFYGEVGQLSWSTYQVPGSAGLLLKSES